MPRMLIRFHQAFMFVGSVNISHTASRDNKYQVNGDKPHQFIVID